MTINGSKYSAAKRQENVEKENGQEPEILLSGMSKYQSFFNTNNGQNQGSHTVHLHIVR